MPTFQDTYYGAVAKTAGPKAAASMKTYAPYGDFWREAQAMDEYTGKASESMSSLQAARKQAMMRDAAESRNRLQASLGSRGLGASYGKGGIGSGQISSFDTGTSERLAESEAEHQRGLMDLEFERDMALKGYLRSAKQAKDAKKVNPLDVISTGVSFFSGGLGGKLLDEIF